MTPQFTSPDVNKLLQQELSTGSYETAEDALIAGLRVLRETRERRVELTSRVAALHDGSAITIDDDQQLGEFLDGIDAEVDRGLKASMLPGK